MLDRNFSFDPVEFSWAGVEDFEIRHILESDLNPLANRSKYEREHPGLREAYLMTQCPEYLHWTCKTLLGIDITPMQACILHMLWTHSFPMLCGSRGLSKSYLLALYSLLRASLVQGSKIVCVGAGFRQSKVIFSYVDSFWRNGHVLRSIYKNADDGPKQGNDMFTFTIGQSKIYFIPLGPGGEKVRGLRANIIIADEMNSMDTDVYEIVVNNFAAVSMNPVDKMKKEAKIKYYKAKNLPIPTELLEASFQNQSVIAGTMGFEHQPMYNYWKKYKEIIDTKGKKLKEAFDGVEVDLTYKDFCIMRLPYELIPKGFMDDKTIARAKATIHIGAYNSEYGCVPVKDSTGFFRRSIIDQCVANDKVITSDPNWPSYCPQSFDAKLKGDRGCQYVMGVDPASESDNFAISIVEVHDEHQRVVYSWTTNREEVKKLDASANYFSFCARHIRNLHKRFNIVKIGIDAQGGGISLSEALHDKDTLRKGDVLMWEEIDKEKPKDTDNFDGEHNLRLVQFSNYAWLANANHSLRKDLESRTILFPRYNAAISGLASEISGESEDNINNIEDLKDELSTIVMTITGTRERWDTPQIKTDSNQIGRMRKDRYSALLIANDLAREINKDLTWTYEIPDVGGRVGQLKMDIEEENAFYGNKEFMDKSRGWQPQIIYRN